MRHRKRRGWFYSRVLRLLERRWLLLAYTITGQRAHGRWIGPAKVVGLVIEFVAASGALLIVRTPGRWDR